MKIELFVFSPDFFFVQSASVQNSFIDDVETIGARNRAERHASAVVEACCRGVRLGFRV
jgi:hypothetical protein